MDYKIVWTDPALADFRDVVEFISINDPFAAGKVGEDILDHIETLRTFPFIGPAYPRSSHDKFREIVCGKYRIFYRVVERPKAVEILTIWHGARGTPRIPQA